MIQLSPHAFGRICQMGVGIDEVVATVTEPALRYPSPPEHGLADRSVFAVASLSCTPTSTQTTIRGFGNAFWPSGQRCFAVAGSPGDAAIVNLTPVSASGLGHGQLISSDIKASPPLASNVNFGPGSVDPNVAVARIGADGNVCFQNSMHSSVHLVADHLGTIAADAYAPATSSGAPSRKVDTRDG